MGAREARNGTESLIFSCEHALYYQLYAGWFAGMTITMVTGIGFFLRLAINLDRDGLLAWLAAAMLIPSLALALGVWSGSSKLFEVIYTLWWYAGPMSHVPGLDFINPASASGAHQFYSVLVCGLLIAAYLGRRRKLAYS
jgi:hypothetical protein